MIGALSSQALAQLQTSAAARIAPQDLLVVLVQDAPEFSRSLRVTAGGEVRMPMMKVSLHVLGLLPSGAAKLIREELSREHLISDRVVSLSVAPR